MKTENTIECAIAWVDTGLPCRYRYGFAFKGAGIRSITTEQAKEYLSHSWVRDGKRYYQWSFGMGFYELRWETDRENGKTYLVFNEYGENDLW